MYVSFSRRDAGLWIYHLFVVVSSLIRFLCQFAALVDRKSPQVSRTLLSILVDLNNVVVWMASTCPLISKSSSIIFIIIHLASFSTCVSSRLVKDYQKTLEGKIIIMIILRVSFSHHRLLMVFHWSLSNSKSTQISRTLLSILDSGVRMVSIHPLISNFSKSLSKPLGTILICANYNSYYRYSYVPKPF